MAVTRSTAGERVQRGPDRAPPGIGSTRGPELLWLAIASAIVLSGIGLTYLALPRGAAPGVLDLTTHQVSLEEAPKMYEVFQKKQDNAFKVVIKP